MSSVTIQSIVAVVVLPPVIEQYFVDRCRWAIRARGRCGPVFFLTGHGIEKERGRPTRLEATGIEQWLRYEHSVTSDLPRKSL